MQAVTLKRLLEATPEKREDHPAGEGLVLRLSPTGAATWVFRYRRPDAKHRVATYKVGSARSVKLKEARRRVTKLRAGVDRGEDPQHERVKARREQAGSTVKALAESFLEAKPRHKRRGGGQWRPKTEELYRTVVKKYVIPKLGSLRLEEVTPQHIRRLVEDIADEHPFMANRVHGTLHRMFGWAMGRGRTSHNPCVGLAEHLEREHPRQETYTNEELRGLAARVKGTRLQHLFGLVLHTGAREGEARAARWRDFDLERELWELPRASTKTGDQHSEPHRIPLSPGALEVLAAVRRFNLELGWPATPDAFLFPAQSSTGHQDKPGSLGRKLGLRLHDVRRSVADRMKNDLHVAPYVVEHLLGHSMPKLVKVYMPSVPLPAMREAVGKWSTEAGRILGPQGDDERGTVVPMVRA